MSLLEKLRDQHNRIEDHCVDDPQYCIYQGMLRVCRAEKLVSEEEIRAVQMSFSDKELAKILLEDLKRITSNEYFGDASGYSLHINDIEKKLNS